MGPIVARATPEGRGALALVRLSGPDLSQVRDAVLATHAAAAWRSGRPRRVDVQDEHGRFDDGIAVWSEAPHTYTGEQTLEVSLHGNPLLVDRLIRACCAAGAKLARPGEFTRRAVEHGKFDLVAAEATDQLIRARTMAGVDVARDGLDGRLAEAWRGVREVLVRTAAELEARMDYPGDELALEDDETLVAGLQQASATCRGLASTVGAGRQRVDGARVALVGAVNAGKSSLFNALLGRRRALVHELAGTTRDVLEVATSLGGLEITLLDTAGERVTTDPVEAAGLALAKELVADADLVVVVLRGSADGLDAVSAEILARTASRRRVIVVNGVDRPGVAQAEWPAEALFTSAIGGDGVDALARHVAGSLADGSRAEGLQLASERQADLLRQVAEACDEAVDALPLAGPAVAADAITEGLQAIDGLAGSDAREAVLDALFERFCIGK
jgi:tRNA modification GTPase